MSIGLKICVLTRAEDLRACAELGVDAVPGELTELGTIATVAGAHCVTIDGAGNAYVADAAHGRLLVIHDALGAPSKQVTE